MVRLCCPAGLIPSPFVRGVRSFPVPWCEKDAPLARSGAEPNCLCWTRRDSEVRILAPRGGDYEESVRDEEYAFIRFGRRLRALAAIRLGSHFVGRSNRNHRIFREPG